MSTRESLLGLAGLGAVVAMAWLGCGGDADDGSGSFGGGGGAGASGTTTPDWCRGAGGCTSSFCDTDCASECGCCGCSTDICGNGTELWRCVEGEQCYEIVQCETDCAFTGFGPSAAMLCIETMSCEQVEAAYEYLVSSSHCDADADCTELLEGHCEVGLGAVCYVPHSNAHVAQSSLDAMAARFVELACPGTPCTCESAPQDVRCVDDKCVLQE